MISRLLSVALFSAPLWCVVVGTPAVLRAEDRLDGWSVLIEAQRLIEKQKPDEAANLAKDLAKSGGQSQLWSEIITLRAMLVNKAAVQSNVISSFVVKISKAVAEPGVSADIRIAWAETLRQLGRLDEAVLIVTAIGAEERGVRRARAAEVLARIMLDQGRMENALATIEIGLGHARPPDKAGGSAGDDDLAAPERRRLSALKDNTLALMDLVKHGLGFKLYREANDLRLKRDFQGALKAWDRLLETASRNAGKPVVQPKSLDDPIIQDLPVVPVYAAAASYYRALALFHLMRWDEAAKASQQILADPANPWMAEALVLMGDIAYEGAQDPKSALAHYVAAAKATRDEAQINRARAAYPVPDVSLTRVKPAADMREKDALGNLAIWSIDKPEQVVNSQTASYYAKRVMINAFLGQIACHVALGDLDRAAGVLELYKVIDPEPQGDPESGLPTSYKRMRDGIRLGHFGAREQEMELFSGALRTRLLRAEILTEASRFHDAWACYDRINIDKRHKLSSRQQAYVDYARAICATYLEDEGAVKSLMAGFLGDKPKHRATYTYWRALFLIADRWPKDAVELYTRGANECDDKSLRIHFMMALGQIAFGSSDFATASKWFGSVIKAGDNEDYRVKAAKQALDHIARETSKSNTKP